MGQPNKAIDLVIDAIRKVPDADKHDFITMVATTSISLMHGMCGKEFTTEYLHAAVDSLDEPTTIHLRQPTKQ